ncbi:MAG: hypothetical protein ACYTEZ_04625 [Planctomycetota bacterium]|jgi:hypothetical protein
MTETTEPTGETGGTTPQRDLVAEFKAMPAAEKLLAAAACAVILGWLISEGWHLFFKVRWFPTCAFLGALGILALTVLDLFGVKIMSAKMRTYVIIALGVVPAVGFVIDALQHFWSAVMLAGAIVMALAAVKITTREKIIQR